MTARTRAMAVVAGLALLAAGHLGAEPVAEPDGYRGPPYRGPVPETVLDMRGLSVAEALALHRAGAAVFVDVLPVQARPEGLPEGTLWRDQVHQSIPGAVWLPGTGYEALDPATEAAFRAALDELTGGDRAFPLVFFCRRACWMSWNAARRALGYGHAGTRWFPEGQDGWEAAGEPLVPVRPRETRRSTESMREVPAPGP